MVEGADRTFRRPAVLAGAAVVLGTILLATGASQTLAQGRASSEHATTPQRSEHTAVPETRLGTRALDCVDLDRGVEADAIYRQRGEFNRGIEEADIDLIEGVLAENVLLITGSDSDLFRGRSAQLDLWQEDFSNPRRLVYHRSAECIRLSPSAPLAVEYGSWSGVAAGEMQPSASGSYTAKWRRDDRGWRLEAELFTTDHCSGVYCPSS